MDDRLQVHLLGGHQRETGIEVKAQLRAEHRQRAGAGAVGLAGAVFEHVAQQVEIRAHGGIAGTSGCGPRRF
jgi:hypothetical protein